MRLSRLSDAALRLEKLSITALAAILVILIFLSIVTRAAGAPIFWVDELAIYTMIWMALIGASAMVRMRSGVAVLLVTDLLPANFRSYVARAVDILVVLFAAVVLYLCWQWYEPVALARSGFDVELFVQNTFNFIYYEPTNTIGISKFWIWLAVPLMALGMTLHAIANLLEGPPDEAAGDGGSQSPLS